MNCPKCGAMSQNPAASQCMYCGQAMAAAPPAPAPGYGAAPQAFGAPQQPYGAPAQPYGASPYGAPTQQPYGANPYGQPPGPGGAYGGPQPPAPFGANPYGGPQPPAPVQQFGGGYAPYTVTTHSGGGFMSTVSGIGNAMFWIRLGIAVFVLSIVAISSCVNALSQ